MAKEWFPLLKRMSKDWDAKAGFLIFVITAGCGWASDSALLEPPWPKYELCLHFYSSPSTKSPLKLSAGVNHTPFQGQTRGSGQALRSKHRTPQSWLSWFAQPSQASFHPPNWQEIMSPAHRGQPLRPFPILQHSPNSLSLCFPWWAPSPWTSPSSALSAFIHLPVSLHPSTPWFMVTPSLQCHTKVCWWF